MQDMVNKTFTKMRSFKIFVGEEYKRGEQKA